MRPKKFIDPSATADLSMKRLCSEYGKLFFAYRDLFNEFSSLKRNYQEKGGVVRAKRQRIQGQRQQRSDGGHRRHESTRAASQFFVGRYWELKRSEQETGKVRAKKIIRDLANWIQNPTNIYGIELGATPPQTIKGSTCDKLYSACNHAYAVCDGDRDRFIAEVPRQRT